MRTIPLFLSSSTRHAIMNLICANRYSQTTICLLQGKVYDPSRASNYNAASVTIRGVHNVRPTLAERRSCSQLHPLQLTSKKRSISVTSEQALDEHSHHASLASPLPLAKRKKEPLAPHSHSHLPCEDGVKANGRQESQTPPQLFNKDAILLQDRESDPCTSGPTDSKALLSPINFGPQLERHEDGSTRTMASQLPEGPRYEYYAPINPSDGQGAYTQLYGTGPRRQLFYGEPFHYSKARSLHKSIGSTELRREAGYAPEHTNSGSWFDDGPSTAAAKPRYSEPSRPKPRLWLDLAEDGEQIEEAVGRLPTQGSVLVLRYITDHSLALNYSVHQPIKAASDRYTTSSHDHHLSPINLSNLHGAKHFDHLPKNPTSIFHRSRYRLRRRIRAG